MEDGKMSHALINNKPLGRGLAALLGTDSPPLDKEKQIVHRISLEELAPGRYQPRESFDQEPLESLVSSIREKGVIQPILIRPIQQGLTSYEIVAGERRWRAAKEAGLTQVPVIIKEMTDLEALETGLIENIQRHDLNPLEEAQGFKRLMDEFQYTQEDLARVLGKSRSYIANSIRLLGLHDDVKQALKERKITAGHARALINIGFFEEILRKIIKNGLSVRQTERLVQRHQRVSSIGETPVNSEINNNIDSDVQKLVDNMTTKLGLKVELDVKKNGSGVINIHFNSFNQLDSLLSTLMN
jgi:ParB family chromosome partitioning protein